MNNLRLSIKSNYPSSFKKFYFLKVIPILLILCISCEKSEPDNTSKLLGLAAIVNSTKTQSYVVTTFAGSGEIGSVDGAGIAASFNYPSGVAVDNNGNIFVAEFGSYKIRKISATGIVTTLAGSGVSGSSDGVGTAASFNLLTAITIDKDANLFVTDARNNKIRKITSAGSVTTIAGSSTAGSIDAVGLAASFNFPSGITIDNTGSIYVSDSKNNKVRKITSSGVVITLAGSGVSNSIDGVGTAASFSNPQGIVIDSNSIIYIADSIGKIRRITTEGVVSTLAGSGSNASTDGSGNLASFRRPWGLAIDGEGIIFVADGNHKIRKVTNSGVVTTVAGTGSVGSADGPGTAASFNYPSGVAVDSNGNIYTADFSNHKIRKITLQ
jgi:sugar lactone lactonase YvrE